LSPDAERRTIGRMSADAIREAFTALSAGDPEPLVALADDRMHWQGRRRLLRPLRPPS
jgi:hypothetical protein